MDQEYQIINFLVNNNLKENLYKNLIKNNQIPLLDYQGIKICGLTHNLGGFNFSTFENLIDPYTDKKMLFYNNFEEIINNDLIVICTQEVVELKSKNITKFMFGASNDFEKFCDFINFKFKNFDVILKEVQGANGLIVLVKNSSKLKYDIWVSKIHRLNLGFMGYVANKCILGVELFINNNKILFFNAHLEAGEHKNSLKKRLDNLKMFQDLLKNEKLDEEFVFLMGDLNFRNGTDYTKMVQTLFDYQNNPDKSKKLIDKLLENDELQIIKKNDKDFIFNEMEINFLPTYKYISK